MSTRKGPLKNEFGEASDYQRPRRPNEDTLAYIKSLPLDIQKSSEEVELFLSKKSEEQQDPEDEHYPQLFAAALSAIEEIKSEIASLAGDEDGSQCLEILARITGPYSELAIRKLLMGCNGYYLHLATHRYGSHVVQTILQLSTPCSDSTDLATKILDDDQYTKEEEGLPSLSDLILGVVEELTPHVSDLAIHICGSHVLRTLLCVLSGIDLIASPGTSGSLAENGNLRRGRAKSKKKKKKKVTTENVTAHAGVMYMVYRKPSSLRVNIGDSFHRALDKLMHSLTGDEESNANPGELQKLACHASAGPLLIVLLRVLTYVSCPDQSNWQQLSGNPQNAANQRQLGIQLPQPKFELDSSAHTLAMKILCWPEESSAADESRVPDVIYGLAGEPRGSHMLETLLRLSPKPFYESILKYGDFYNRTTLQDYIDDPVSNFVVQTLLNTIQTKEQAESILKAISPIISSGSVIDPQKHRRGILWRAVELAANKRVGQDALLKAIRLGFAALAETTGADSSNDPKDSTDDEPKQKKKERRKASAVNLPSCILELIDAKVAKDNEERVTIDASGARTVYFMMRFAPRLCGDTFKGITSYSPEMLALLARDSLASRCVWDGVLEGPTDNPAFSSVLPQLREKLSGQWVSLGCDRVGQHVVKKMFRELPEKERLKLVEELSQGVPHLGGNAMGRSVLDVCCVRQFTQGIDAWNQALKKARTQEEWLSDMLGDNGPSSSERSRKRSLSGEQSYSEEKSETKKSKTAQ